ncbi:arginine--tRNA ligase [Gynuella sunshinyii]|uniref:Arginine--tRNA ligase n=1 Tax=Gynuella sunshinyii YC6258 TaxID=1445510 RepID=A0A0C5VSC4_9GAMM|nr:arginine--tRNA ligase [Gynuella sunshinyii]AJQ97121.1 arginyl-tRNA synthetase [Gynuella sunshinyii YC6258]
MNIRALLSEKVAAAMAAAGIPAEFGPNLALSKNPQFGDYQANGAMAAAKAMKSNPRQIADSIIQHLDLTGLADKVEIAGPGFINIYLSSAWLAGISEEISTDAHLTVQAAEPAQTIVIDYSAPNLAKEMHVGHLRSTIIGDAMARLSEFLGHRVVRQNHIGDWGTQFGMLIAELEETLSETSQSFQLKDLESFYQQAKKHFDEDPAFADKAREYVVRLQRGDEGVYALWQQFIQLSLAHSEELYERLNVSLSREDVRGESYYNDQLASTVADLEAKGLVVEDQGAKVAFLEEFADKDGKPGAYIVQKQGGGFLYATTDLAAMQFRIQTLKADRILIFTDARQGLHFKQLFTLSRKAGYAPDAVELVHCAFGMMMGADGKPFKTRSGGTVKLAELVDEAIERSEKLVAEKNPELDAEQQQEVARKVAIGAVKYADLSKTRTNDYVFNWDAMLSFEGNTAPYLQYAYTRIQSIFRKAGESDAYLRAAIVLEHEQERALALKLAQFEEVLLQVYREAMPHSLCAYLYDLAGLTMSFYENCAILKEGVDPAVRDSRLRLSHGVASTLRCGLDLLGIEVMERM